MKTYRMVGILKPMESNGVKIKNVTIPIGAVLRRWNKKQGMHFEKVTEPIDSVQLIKGNTIWMTDDPMEQDTNVPAINSAKGDVLECGLGIGMFTYHVSRKKNVKSVDVVEIDQDVINLVGEQILNDKIAIQRIDAEKYLKRIDYNYDYIHIDIWSGINQPYDEMEKYDQLARQHLNQGGTLDCWLMDNYNMIKNNIRGKRENTGFGVLPPCLVCGKTFRNDYGGLCMDCADSFGISEIY